MRIKCWGPDVSNLDLDHLVYYVRPSEKSEKNWDDVPETIKNTFDKLGIPEAEQKFAAGVIRQVSGCFTQRLIVLNNNG